MPSSFYHPKNASLLLALAAIAILASVFVMQYGFGLAPCRMCIWQRWPFAALAVIGLIGAFVWPRVMLSIAVAVLLVSIGLGGYHVGVEQGLIPLPAGCSTVGEAGSVEELKAMLKAAPPKLQSGNGQLLRPIAGHLERSRIRDPGHLHPDHPHHLPAPVPLHGSPDLTSRSVWQVQRVAAGYGIW